MKTERDKVIQIRVTEQEKQKILRNANRCKMSVSSYIRELIKGIQPKEFPADLHWLCFEIELMIDDFGNQKDQKFQEYLQGFLEGIRFVLYEKEGE